MKSEFTSRLVNGPFGDPGLHIASRWQGHAMHFDLGRIDRFPASDLTRVRRVFVSHAHMDHFYGFDRLLRLFLSRDATIEMYGPPGITGNVISKLGGYTWNLTEGYPFVLQVHELDERTVRSTELAATTAFTPKPLGEYERTDVLVDRETFRVRTAYLDHRIPCLAFALEERSHLNIQSHALERIGAKPGRWLNQLKSSLRENADTNSELTVPFVDGSERSFRMGELRDELVEKSPGLKVGYVVDTLFSHGNMEKIVDAMAGADIFYCEAPFLDEDRHEATRRFHLTARQAGTLARRAKVRELKVFHFSPRYDGQAARIYEEAEGVFSGRLAEDEPDR